MFGTNSFKTLVAAGALALMAGGASAGTVTSGSFVGTFEKNDPFPKAIFPGTDDESVALWKCDDIGGGDDPSCTSENAGAGDYSTSFSITFDYFKGDDDDDEVEAIGGTWSFVLGLNTLLPKYIVLKAGNEHSVWDIGGLSTGYWSTSDTLDSKGISHISFYDSYTAPIPLPAAGFLLIGALGGLAALRRRKTA